MTLLQGQRTSTRARQENGVSAGGLMTAVQPAARAAPSFRVIIAEGKFHGVRIPLNTKVRIRCGIKKTWVRLPHTTRLQGMSTQITMKVGTHIPTGCFITTFCIPGTADGTCSSGQCQFYQALKWEMYTNLHTYAPPPQLFIQRVNGVWMKNSSQPYQTTTAVQ